MSIEETLQQICKEVVQELNLPEEGIHVFSYVSKSGGNKGNETSKSICINEPEYPINHLRRTRPNRSQIIMNIPSGESDEVELLIKSDQFNQVPVPWDGIVKEGKEDTFQKVVFQADAKGLPVYIKDHIKNSVKQYRSGNSFGCCSKYRACSEAGQCIHENLLYATGCAYRQNLERGDVFYREG